jgi:hypothetical protein
VVQPGDRDGPQVPQDLAQDRFATATCASKSLPLHLKRLKAGGLRTRLCFLTFPDSFPSWVAMITSV